MQHSYGALRNETDHRDIKLTSVQGTVEIPQVYKTDISMLPVKDQGIQPACVGHAISQVLQYFNYCETGKLTEISPRYIYGVSKAIDGYPEVEGTMPRIGAKVVHDNGGATESVVPNTTNLSKDAYKTIPDRVKADKSAVPYKVKGYAFPSLSAEDLCQAIYQNKLVTISVEMGDSTTSFIRPGDRGLHYIVLYGYQILATDTLFFFRNSWGNHWGENGDGVLSYREFEGKMHDAIAFVDLSPEVLEDAKTGYKYFSPSEIVGLNPKLVQMLDIARGYAGIPFKITSGFRSPDQNKKAGGVDDSAHLSGLAVDIACPDSGSRYKMTNALLRAGFNRIGVGKTFIHADIDSSKPQNVIWDYYQPSTITKITDSMQTFMEGKKTYIGIIMLLLGAIGVSKYVTNTEVSSIVDSVLQIVGAVVAIYGRYNATQQVVSVQRQKTLVE